jgi:hypothetical protein
MDEEFYRQQALRVRDLADKADPGRRHMAASLRAFVDLAHEIVVRSCAKAS